MHNAKLTVVRNWQLSIRKL